MEILRLKTCNYYVLYTAIMDKLFSENVHAYSIWKLRVNEE